MPEVDRYEQDERGYWPLVIHPKMLVDLQAMPDFKDDFPYILVPTVATSLTGDVVRRAIEKMRDNVVRPLCRHVVHPHVRGWTSCANCGEPVWAGNPPSTSSD